LWHNRLDRLGKRTFYDTDPLVSGLFVANVRTRRRNFSVSAALPCSTEAQNSGPCLRGNHPDLCGCGIFFRNDFWYRLCLLSSGDNLCGLAGIFIIGPLVSAFAIVLIGSLILLLPADK
jgi:hypothetical protein